jgi:hypothetical protein
MPISSFWIEWETCFTLQYGQSADKLQDSMLLISVECLQQLEFVRQ